MTAPPNTLPAPAEDPSPEQAQERIDQTLSRLSAYRNVRGVMVLSRRVAASAAAGSAGDTENASTSTHTSTPPTNGAEGTGGIAGIVQSTGSVFEGDGGRRYAKAVEGIVLAVTRGMDECDAGVSGGRSRSWIFEWLALLRYAGGLSARC